MIGQYLCCTYLIRFVLSMVCTIPRVIKPPGGGSSITFSGPSDSTVKENRPPVLVQQPPPVAKPVSQPHPVPQEQPKKNIRTSSKVMAPPGGRSQITFG